MGSSTNTNHAADSIAAAPITALRTALQGDVFLDQLRAQWPTAARDYGTPIRCNLLRVHLRGDSEFVLELELTTRNADGEQTHHLAGELVGEKAVKHHAQAIASLRKPRRKQLDSEEIESRILCFPELGLVLRFPGLDERLPGLMLIHKMRNARPVLAPFTNPPGQQINKVGSSILAHRLGKRCTVKFKLSWTDPETEERKHRSVIAKMYKARSAGAQQNYDRAHALAAAGLGESAPVRIAPPLGVLEEYNTLIMRRVKGDCVDDLAPSEYAAGIAACGRSIAALHAIPTVVDATHTVDDECAILERWGGFVVRVHTELAEATSTLCKVICGELRTLADAPTAMIHRDFYQAQVLVSDDHSTLLDFDTLCVGDPALDLGNFLAHLDLVSAQGLRDTTGLDEIFLDAYGSGSQEVHKRIHIYRRSALLRLACLYSFWPRWGGVSETLLARLER